MIKVQDWMASIPDEEKHIAYVGEGKSVQKGFWLCGEGWEDYQNWSFYLDMAFDPESVTTRDTRQVEQTVLKGKEAEDIGDLYTDETVTKESYTVNSVKVQEVTLTDIAPLTKQVRGDGVYLTWTVLRQHTQLPGKLWATLRGVGSAADQVKKSAIMVFEVDAAVCATAAAATPISEMEQIRQQAAAAKDSASAAAQQAQQSAADALNCQYICEDRADQVVELRAEMMTETAALRAEMTAQAQAVQQARQQAESFAGTADDCRSAAAEHAAAAEEARFAASSYTNSAVMACQQAVSAAQEAEQAIETITDTVGQAQTAIGNAVNHCNRYTQRCEIAATSMDTTIQAVDNLTYRRVNVRDCGAVGDGVTDDRYAILDAFELAKKMLPCEVYFPAGTYGISNGMYIQMDLGTGGLRVCGEGRDVTTIRYLDSFAELGSNRQWYAIRIEPISAPATEEEYLHDISYSGLTVYDPNPCANAWHPDKGDRTKEETHGFDLCYVKGGAVTECQFITVGDEAIDILSCHDVVVMNNRCIGSPAAGTSGGAISIGDGSVGVVVSNNIVNGSAADETLDNGTIITKNNFGIAVESLMVPVRDVVITGNVIHNVQGNGINLGATNSGAGLYNIAIEDNIIRGCNNGISDEGGQPKDVVSICNNLISDCAKHRDGYGYGIRLEAVGYTNVSLCGNTVRNTDMQGMTVQGVDTVIDGNLLENIGAEAMFIPRSAIIRNCIIKNTGMGSNPGSAALSCYGDAVYTVSGCRLTGVRQAKGLYNPTEVENTTIAFVDADGNAVTNNKVVDSDRLKRLVNCRLDGWMEIRVDHTLVQGVILNSGQMWQAAIKVSANGVMISGCHITAPTSRDAIQEQASYNGNLFANNLVNRPITTVGAQTVAVNNVDLRGVMA